MARLELIGITKRYPGVVANDGVNLRVQPGEIHAVLGENGAGKSTLMKIAYGAAQPDAGEVRWHGARVALPSPEAARALGVAMVFQHFSLFDTLSVTENVWLGLESTSRAEVAARIRSVAGEYGLELDPDRYVHALSVGERQRVELVRALLFEPKLLILDEPTSVLAPAAVEKLFRTLRRLAERGCSILYVSHKLDEIRALCHRCTVLRAGRVSGEVDPSRASNAELSELMIGGAPPKLEQRARTPGDLVLRVRGLDLPQHDDFAVALRDLELDVRASEIVGIAGVSGNGQRELMAALSGEDDRAPAGSIQFLNQDLAGLSPARRRALGLRFAPEERLGRAAVPSLSLARNALLTRSEPVGRAGFLRTALLDRLTRRLIETYRVQARGPRAPARTLSGGNLQRFILGRELDARPKLFLVSQPTWGIDVGAAARIRSQLAALCDAGSAVLLVSDDLDELFEISDTLLVMAGGRLSPPIRTRDATPARIGEWMSGLWPERTPSAGAAKEEPRAQAGSSP